MNLFPREEDHVEVIQICNLPKLKDVRTLTKVLTRVGRNSDCSAPVLQTLGRTLSPTQAAATHKSAGHHRQYMILGSESKNHQSRPRVEKEIATQNHR